MILSISILLSGFGLTISKMFCDAGCASFFSVGAIQECCKNEKSKEGFFFESECCDISNLILNIDTFIPAELAVLKVQDIIINFLPFEAISFKYLNYKKEICNKGAPPLQVAGKTLLNQLCILRI